MEFIAQHQAIGHDVLRRLRDLRPVYGSTHLRMQRALELGGMDEDEALETICRLARDAKIVVCGPLLDPHPDTPVLPNHVRVGDDTRIVRALLGAPDEERAASDGNLEWAYVLMHSPIDDPDDAEDERQPRSAFASTRSIVRIEGPPMEMSRGQSLHREITFGSTGHVLRDVVVVRTA